MYFMGVNEKDNSQLVAYHLNEGDNIWYKMWVDGRAPGEVPITWDILKIALVERFFYRE